MVIRMLRKINNRDQIKDRLDNFLSLRVYCAC